MNIKKLIKDTLNIKLDKSFGLDIGDRSVEIIELEKLFKFSVNTYGRVELPEGVVENGKILNKAILAEKLKILLRTAKPRKVSTNKVVLSLPDSQVFIKYFEIDSKLKSVDLAKIITDKVSVSLPISLDKYYWDFMTKPLADSKKKLVVFACVSKDIANSYINLCNSIGLEVTFLCLESFSLAKVLLKSSNKQSLIIDIGSGSTNLSFFDSNDKINMAFTIPLAGEQMTLDISERLKIEREEAEKLKIKFGFIEDKENEIRSIILPVMEDILKETKQAIEYYEQSFNQKLDEIYITGGSVLLPGIIDLIKSFLQREVLIVNSSGLFDFKNLFTNKNFALFANVIGLGIFGSSGKLSDINLLKSIPKSEINSINKLNLLNMGYLNKVNAFRTIINNKLFLVTLLVLIGIIFAVLIQQAQNYVSISTLFVS